MMQPPQTTQPPPQLPPNSPSQISQSESSPFGKGKERVQNPREKKTDITRIPRKEEEGKLLAKIWVQIFEDPTFGHSKLRGTKFIVPERHMRAVDDVVELNELFRNDPHPYPPGKPRPPKSKTSDSTTTAECSSSREAWMEFV
ncbi:hypothetical protein Tco_1239415 [Tanacetum coccineum]